MGVTRLESLHGRRGGRQRTGHHGARPRPRFWDAVLKGRLFRHRGTLKDMLTFLPTPGEVTSGYGLGVEQYTVPGDSQAHRAPRRRRDCRTFVGRQRPQGVTIAFAMNFQDDPSRTHLPGGEDARGDATLSPAGPGLRRRRAVLVGLVGPARLAPQARARRQPGRNAHPGTTGSRRLDGICLRVRDRHGRRCRFGSVSPNDQIGWSPFGAAIVDADARAGAVGVPLVVERDRDLDEAVAPASARRRPARRLRTGSSGVLLAASSLRSLPRSQPPWTKVSLPSGRTSLIVAWRSTFGVEERTQACTAPAPMTVVVGAQRARSGTTRALPAGLCGPLVGRRRGPQAAGAGRGVAGEVGQRARVGVPGERVRARLRRAWRRRARRSAPRYQRPRRGARDREARRTTARSRGPGSPGLDAAGAVVEQDADRRQLLERRQRARRRSAAAGSGRAAASRP